MIKIEIGSPPQIVTVELQARKTLDGNLLILDHDLIDIVVVPDLNKVVTFPKDAETEDTYHTQAKLLEFMSARGTVDRETIQGGNIFNSLEGVIPPSEEANSLQAAVYIISEFIKEEAELRQKVEEYQHDIEQYYLDPQDIDSTELGEVAQETEKGAMVPGYYYIPLRYRY